VRAQQQAWLPEKVAWMRRREAREAFAGVSTGFRRFISVLAAGYKLHGDRSIRRSEQQRNSLGVSA
jgi:hypothetical protein